MSVRGIYWLVAMIFMLILSIGELALIHQNGFTVTELGSHTIVGKILTTTSIIFQIAFLVVTGIEFIVRAYLSAFGFPCSFQRREICCFEYKMTTFWKALRLVSGIGFAVAVVVAVLMVFLDEGLSKFLGNKYNNLTLTIIMVAVPLIHLILSSIANYLAQQEFYEQYPVETETDTEAAGDSGNPGLMPMMTVPTAPAAELESVSIDGALPPNDRGKKPEVDLGKASA